MHQNMDTEVDSAFLEKSDHSAARDGVFLFKSREWQIKEDIFTKMYRTTLRYHEVYIPSPSFHRSIYMIMAK